MRTTYVYDADLDAVVPKRGRNYFEPEPRGPHIISDSLPGGVNGIVHPANGRRYDSKKRFRDETRARGCTEVGNEKWPARRPQKLPDPRPAMKQLVDHVTPMSRHEYRQFFRELSMKD
jgi:hypothetical protein